MASLRVAYLGPIGTFSHIVARQRFGGEAGLLPRADLTGIIDFVREDGGERALVPVENTSGGTIYGTVDLLIESAERVFVTESIALDVRMALIGREGERIERVFSHSVQLHNHREWFRENLPGVEVESVASTALAAELARDQRGAAALSAPGAAEIYGLDVLRCPILEGPGNVTHFFVLAGERQAPPEATMARTAVAVSFGNEPGSLFRFLEPFARAEVNVNRIISRPFPGRVDQVMFFLEIDGAPGSETFDEVMRVARDRSEVLIDFGSYGYAKKFRS
ncbi:MAG: prephenate dehydratase domain-containing protein [Chthoniobacterales bacterium]